MIGGPVPLVLLLLTTAVPTSYGQPGAEVQKTAERTQTGMDESAEATQYQVERRGQEATAGLEGFAADYEKYSQAARQPESGASPESVISSVLKEMSQDATNLQNMLVKELSDLRRIVSYDAAIRARLMQLFPSLDLENILEAMKGVVTKRLAALQALLGGAQSMPDSLI
ncbi:hypothetical protein CSUI_008718 [Cystoisospora suis]|uniref:Transmembrane protein n=1 Tax=Cystoisospora suis TaxID=483139 RepID=A0A2C6KK07_9APIC|nr:hypothetical protein CSUI_008718 [Cystoisospora suis]